MVWLNLSVVGCLGAQEMKSRAVFCLQSFKQAPLGSSILKAPSMTASSCAGGHRNHVTIPSILEAEVKILPHWNVTLPLWQYHKHIHAQGEGGACGKVACDCTHTCAPAWGQLFLPGAPPSSCITSCLPSLDDIESGLRDKSRVPALGSRSFLGVVHVTQASSGSCHS